MEALHADQGDERRGLRVMERIQRFRSAGRGHARARELPRVFALIGPDLFVPVLQCRMLEVPFSTPRVIFFKAGGKLLISSHTGSRARRLCALARR